jgi:signal transduction histidine kinase
MQLLHTPAMTPTTALEAYPDQIARLLFDERFALSQQWLARLHEILDVRLNEVFPTDQLLDHIPALIGDMATYLRAPGEEEIAANAAVIGKAQELGLLRYDQKASVHQLLREYEILGELLEVFVANATAAMAVAPAPADCFEVQRRLTRSARTLMRTTVDTFLAEYTSALAERNQRLDAFNRMASHEMRTPIGTLTFAATLLRSAEVAAVPEHLEQVATVVENSAKRLTWLVNNLQRLARIGDPVDVPTHQMVDVQVVAEEVRRQLEEMAVTRGVMVRIDPSLPTVLTDPARLELVLLNLVSNAIKYRDPEKSEPFVEISHRPASAVASAESVPRWTLLVRDNGLGIPPEHHRSIFSRFVRVHPHMDGTLGVTGSGLGLSIVADCVEALGGTIGCESQPGAGTTFAIQLPLLDAEIV